MKRGPPPPVAIRLDPYQHGSVPKARSKPQTLQLPKGLSKSDAWRLAFKRAKRDFRGGKYNPATGKMVLI